MLHFTNQIILDFFLWVSVITKEQNTEAKTITKTSRPLSSISSSFVTELYCLTAFIIVLINKILYQAHFRGPTPESDYRISK